MTALQETLNKTFANLPKPVEVVEKAFDISEQFLATARKAAVDAAKAISPEAPKAKKAPAKKPVAATTATAE